jgi:hypothetical protein
MEIRERLDSTDRQHATPDQTKQKKIKRIVQKNNEAIYQVRQKQNIERPTIWKASGH